MTQLFAWNFLGTGQADVADLSGNGRGFTPTGNNTRTAAGGGYTYGGARPNAVGFRQTASDTQIGPAITGLNVTPRTVCGWAIITGSANGWVISMDRVDGGNPTGTGVFGVYNNSGAPQFRCKDNSGSAFTRSFTGNAAYRFYALTYDGTNLKVYQSDGAGVVAQVGANIAMGSVWDATRILLLQQMGSGPTLSDWQGFDTALSLTQLQAVADTPLDAPSGTTVNAAAETDAAQPVSRLRSVAAGITTETDAAQPATRLRSVSAGIVTETDAAQPAGRLRSVPIGTALEVDAAQSAAHLGAVLGAAGETDTAQPITRARLTLVGTATEADTAPALGSGHSTAVAPASESDNAQPVQRLRTVQAAPGGETDTAPALTRARSTSIGTAVEADEARPAVNPNAVVRDLDLVADVEPGRFTSTVEPGRFRSEIAS